MLVMDLRDLRLILRRGHGFYLVARPYTTRKGSPISTFVSCKTILVTIAFLVSFLDMMRTATANFPSSVFDPPPEAPSNAPALNLNLGNVNVSLGGANSGVYRTNGKNGVSVQADGIRDGVRNLLGKVKEGVDRIGLQ